MAKKNNNKIEDNEYIKEEVKDELMELEEEIERRGVLPKEFLLLLRYLHARDRLLLRNLMEYNRIMRSEEISAIFVLARKLNEEMEKSKKEQQPDDDITKALKTSLLTLVNTIMANALGGIQVKTNTNLPAPKIIEKA